MPCTGFSQFADLTPAIGIELFSNALDMPKRGHNNAPRHDIDAPFDLKDQIAAVSINFRHCTDVVSAFHVPSRTNRNPEGQIATPCKALQYGGGASPVLGQVAA